MLWKYKELDSAPLGWLRRFPYYTSICFWFLTPRFRSYSLFTRINLNDIRLSGKFVKLTSEYAREAFGFHHCIEGVYLLWYTTFGLIDAYRSYEKKRFYRPGVLISQKRLISSIEQSSSFSRKKDLLQAKSIRSWKLFATRLLHHIEPLPNRWMHSKTQDMALKLHLDLDDQRP